MKIIFFVTLLFFFLSFCSFASESNSKISTETEITTNHFAKKQQRFNFKEKLAVKLIEKKIKKVQTKDIKSKKGEGDKLSIFILISILLILGG